MDVVTIQTARLRLSPLVPNDAPALFHYRSDPEVSRFQSFAPSTLEDSEKFIARLQGVDFNVDGTWFQFGIRLQDSGQLIGDIGVHFCEDGPAQVEIGFTLAGRFQGRGYATEAVTGVFDLLFGTYEKHRVFASVDPRNTPSCALLKRLGMRQEAHFVKSLWIDNEWVDDVVFGILESEWKKRHGGSPPG